MRARPWTVGHGVNAPELTRKRPDLCAQYGHPGVTYNPWMDQTWCLCGEVVYDGNRATHADCCGGPLEETLAQDTLPFEAGTGC